MPDSRNTAYRLAPFSRLIQSGQKQTCQDRNHSDYDKKFDKSKFSLHGKSFPLHYSPSGQFVLMTTEVDELSIFHLQAVSNLIPANRAVPLPAVDDWHLIPSDFSHIPPGILRKCFPGAPDSKNVSSSRNIHGSRK